MLSSRLAGVSDRPRKTALAVVLGVLCALMLWPTVGLAAETAPATDRPSRRTPIVEVFERNRNAVVNIAATMEVENYETIFPNRLFGSPKLRKRKQQYTGIGTGFIIHPAGYVVTNAHVVMRAVGLKVIFPDEKEYEAQRVAIDEKHDLAILKIQADESFSAVTLGRSDDLMIGETVVAIGNAMGYQHTVTSGIISATDRTLQFDEQVSYDGLIQTDASINRGNSGGPLLNINGDLIGINTAIRGDAENIGFAIPVDTLRQLLPEMFSVEYRKQRMAIGLRLSWRGRVYVVDASGPAVRAGIESGDELVSVDGQPVRKDLDFYVHLLQAKPDQPLVLGLTRDGQSVEKTLRPEPIPVPDGAKLLRERTGLTVRPLTPREAAKIHAQLEGGLLITGVEYDSPASRSGFGRGHVIIQIGQQYPKNLDEVGLLLENLERGQTLLFRVLEVRRRDIWILQGELTLR